MSRHLIINSELNIGLKYIDGIYEYNTLILDDISMYMKNKEMIKKTIKDSVIIFGNKNDLELITKEFNEFKISTIQFNGIYAYIIGEANKYLKKDFTINLINNNSIKDDEVKKPFNLYTIDCRYSFLIFKIFNLYDLNEMNILDCSLNEDITQSLIYCAYNKESFNITKIGKLTHKTELLCKIYEEIYEKVNIY